MKEQLENRLKSLEQELEKGQGQLHKLDEQRSALEHTLLRISGAIQVLKEELEMEKKSNGQEIPVSSDNLD